MSIQLNGIKSGQTIKLSENLNIPDDSQVLVEVQEVEKINLEEKLQKMKEFLEKSWEGKEEFLEIMAEIDRERHSYYGRATNHLDE
ncbi:MAG: hypothetical protein QNJ32_01330 [Xenococcaceae cyanobacterium MO_167.B27]|nr:hypothetical protein [Xenococcaceae cyanobacterium MO_167.B27]